MIVGVYFRFYPQDHLCSWNPEIFNTHFFFFFILVDSIGTRSAFLLSAGYILFHQSGWNQLAKNVKLHYLHTVKRSIKCTLFLLTCSTKRKASLLFRVNWSHSSNYLPMEGRLYFCYVSFMLLYFTSVFLIQFLLCCRLLLFFLF